MLHTKYIEAEGLMVSEKIFKSVSHYKTMEVNGSWAYVAYKALTTRYHAYTLLPFSAQCRATIGPPAKRLSNGVALAGRW